MPGDKPQTCLLCYETVAPRRVMPGSTWIAALLVVLGLAALAVIMARVRLDGPAALLVILAVGLAPAALYQCSRLRRRHLCCARCGHPEVVPPDSPRGRAIRRIAGARAEEGPAT